MIRCPMGLVGVWAHPFAVPSTFGKVIPNPTTKHTRLGLISQGVSHNLGRVIIPSSLKVAIFVVCIMLAMISGGIIVLCGR